MGLQQDETLLEEWNNEELAILEVPDVNDNDVRRSIDNGLPLILPWHRHKTVRLGTCFHSSRYATSNPWGEEIPFMLQDIALVPKVLRREYGTVASYTSVSTSQTSETPDHLSLGFGVGVGLPFLASVSIKGTYDKEVLENKDVSTQDQMRQRAEQDLIYTVRQNLSTIQYPCR